MRRRLRPPPSGRRRSAGTRSARSPAKLSELTRPSATSSPRASSACEGRSELPGAISSKNEAPWDERYSDRKSTRLNSSHGSISYAVFCLKKKKKQNKITRDKVK